MLDGGDMLEAISQSRKFGASNRDATDRQKLASQRQRSASDVATVSADENI
jgi:hypothetical protein